MPELADAPPHLQTSALFCKGRHRFADGSLGFFHLQITAAGLGEVGADAEAELFKKVLDIDTVHRFKAVSDTYVVITIRCVGEMQPQNRESFVRLDSEPDEFGMQRAFVQLQTSRKDNELWDVMDSAADDLALVLAGGGAYEVQTPAGFLPVGAGGRASQVSTAGRRDGLGTTHHEAGTLWMGSDPATSVTDPDARFHSVANAYAIGPALQPTVGSPNPMLVNVALARRLADHLVPVAPSLEEGPRSLFNGVDLRGWEMAGPGAFVVCDGALQAILVPTSACCGARRRRHPTSCSGANGAALHPTTTPASSSGSHACTPWAMATPPGLQFDSDSRSRSMRPARPTASTCTGPARSTANGTRPATSDPALPPGRVEHLRGPRPRPETYTVTLDGRGSPGSTTLTRDVESRPSRTPPASSASRLAPGTVAFRNIQLEAL